MDQQVKSESKLPIVELKSLDILWFQVGGTRCNLECSHCFISCSPHNDKFDFLDYESVAKSLEESKQYGVKEFYFTGGEPFLNRDIVAILSKTLEYGPATVLTNATVLKKEWLEELQTVLKNSCHPLEFRVSIDGPSPETNDPIRGEGTFERAMKGVKLLVENGFQPIITMTRVWECCEEKNILESFKNILKENGYEKPRLKVLPRLKIGAEENRTTGYCQQERVTSEMLEDYDPSQLLCSHSRLVSDKGVHVCPILLDEPDSLMGENLEQSLGGYSIHHGACHTCYLHGEICTNTSVECCGDS
jgi:AdoMet-dependent heme synthase